MSEFRPNANFASTVKRSSSLDPESKQVVDYDFFNKTVSTFGVGSIDPNSTKGSTITMVENLNRPGAD